MWRQAPVSTSRPGDDASAVRHLRRLKKSKKSGATFRKRKLRLAQLQLMASMSGDARAQDLKMFSGCSAMHAVQDLKRCLGCKAVFYCGKKLSSDPPVVADLELTSSGLRCQKAHWKYHKGPCRDSLCPVKLDSADGEERDYSRRMNFNFKDEFLSGCFFPEASRLRKRTIGPTNK